jgi:hypothetical protein
VGQVRHCREHRLQALLDALQLSLKRLERGGDQAGFGQQRTRILPFRLGIANLLGKCIAPRLQVLLFGLNALALIFEGLELRLRENESAHGEPFDNARQVFSKDLDIKHAELLERNSRRAMRPVATGEVVRSEKSPRPRWEIAKSCREIAQKGSWQLR